MTCTYQEMWFTVSIYIYIVIDVDIDIYGKKNFYSGIDILD